VTQKGGAMQQQRQGSLLSLPQLPAAVPGGWLAVQTKPRHEKKSAAELEEKDIEVFLPMYSAIHHWSDRKKEIQLPLFPNYLFVRITESRNERALVLRTNGVLSFVGTRGVGSYIPDGEIEAVQRVLTSRAPFTHYPFLNVGQKVRIRGGSLDGVSGILAAVNNDRSLIISVECVQRSIAIRIDGYGVEAA
jgi:transcription antitermination factor NusG